MLSLFHYYVNRTITTTYFAVCAPFVLIVCYWIQKFLLPLQAPRRRKVLLGLAGGVVLGLLASQSFLVYPNMFNLAGVSFEKEEKAMMEYCFHPEDVALISRLTRPEDKVCLISSWEINTLIAANRRPFFYYFNIIYPSVPMPWLEFGGFSVYSKKRFEKTLRQIGEEKPKDIFIEKKLFSKLIPDQYCGYCEQLKVLVDYLQANYVVGEEGHWLVALKRKTN